MGLGLLWSYLVNDSDERVGCVISNDSVLYKIIKQRKGYVYTDINESSGRQQVETIQEAVNKIFGKDRGMISFMLGRDGLLAPSKYTGCSSNVITNNNYKKNTLKTKEYFWGYAGDRAIVLSIVDNVVVYQLLDSEELLYRRRERYYNIVYTDEKIQLRDKKMRKFGANGLSVFPPYMSLKCVRGIKCNVVEKIDEGAFEQFTIGTDDAYSSDYIRKIEQGQGNYARYGLLKRYGQFGRYAGVVAFVDYIYNTDKADLEGYKYTTFCELRSGLEAMRSFLIAKGSGRREKQGDRNTLLNYLVLEDYKTKVLEPYIKQIGHNSDGKQYIEFMASLYDNVMRDSVVIERSRIPLKNGTPALNKIVETQKRLDRLHIHYCDIISNAWVDIDYDNLEYNVCRFFREYYKLAKGYAAEDIILAYNTLVEIMGLPVKVQEGVIDCLIADRYNRTKLNTTGLIADYSTGGQVNVLVTKQIERIIKRTQQLKTGTAASVHTKAGVVQVNALGYLILTLLQISTPILIAQSDIKLLQEYRYNFVNAWHYVAENKDKPKNLIDHDLLTMLDYYSGDTYTTKLLKLIDVELLKAGNSYFEDCIKMRVAFERAVGIKVPLHYFMVHKARVNKNMRLCQFEKEHFSSKMKRECVIGRHYLDNARYDIGLKLMTETIFKDYCYIIIKTLYNLQGSAVALTTAETDREINSICADITNKLDNMWLWNFCIQARKYLLTPQINVGGRYGALLTDIVSIPYRKGYKAKIYSPYKVNMRDYKKDEVLVLRQRVEGKKVQPLFVVDDLKKIKALQLNDNTEQFLTNSVAAILRRTHLM